VLSVRGANESEVVVGLADRSPAEVERLTRIIEQLPLHLLDLF
jgi:hypothetical protein